MHRTSLIRNRDGDDTAYTTNSYSKVIFSYFLFTDSELNDLNFDVW